MKHLMLLAAATLLTTLRPASAPAHCDTMNGPVVQSGRQALESGDIRAALIWVKPADESEIRTAFDRTMGVRRLGGEARFLADRFFFETLVRVHRAGEGAGFSGLKESDVAPEPGIAAAEESLHHGSVDKLTEKLSDELHGRLQDAFARTQALKSFKTGDLEAGRHYVEAYVNYIHLVERVHRAITASGEDHAADAGHRDN